MEGLSLHLMVSNVFLRKPVFLHSGKRLQMNADTKIHSDSFPVLMTKSLGLGVFLPIAGSALFYIFAPDWRWPHEHFHALIEGLGGFIALCPWRACFIS